MKKQISKSIAMIALAIATTTSFSYAQEKGKEKEVDHHVGEPGKGPHGGTIEEAEPNHLEILNKDGKVMFYMLNGDAEKKSNAGVTGTVMFMMKDKSTIKGTLTPMGDDGFSTDAKKASDFSRCIVTLKVNGKTTGMIYQCPMHPNETSDNPGKCPQCGMDLVKAKAKTDEHHHQH